MRGCDPGVCKKLGMPVQGIYIKTSQCIPTTVINVICDYYNFKSQMTVNGTKIPSGVGSLKPREGCL